ncbi:hypothetical protein Tco_1192415 [Tanacetum coccineum]
MDGEDLSLGMRVVIGQATVGAIEAGALNMCDTAQTRLSHLMFYYMHRVFLFWVDGGSSRLLKPILMQAALESLLHLIDQVEYINSGKPESDDYILSFNILLENATNKKELEEFHRLKAQKEAMGTNIGGASSWMVRSWQQLAKMEADQKSVQAPCSLQHLFETGTLVSSLFDLCSNYSSKLFSNTSYQQHLNSYIDYMYIKSYSFGLFSSLTGVLTPVRGESLNL